MDRKYDITGLKYGKLTAIEKVKYKGNKNSYWKFKCECGNYITLRRDEVKRGSARKDCGLCYGTKKSINPIYYNKEWLFQKYVIEGLTFKEIANLAGVNSRNICNKIVEHQIKRNTVSMAGKNNICTITNKQKSILVGLLFKRHKIERFSKRANATIYLLSYEHQFCEWLLNELDGVIVNKECFKEPNSYLIETKFSRDLYDMIDDRPLNLLLNLDEMSLSIKLLLDGYRLSGSWIVRNIKIIDDENEQNKVVDLFKHKFKLNISFSKKGDKIIFDSNESNIIEALIKRNVPYKLDLVTKRLRRRKMIRRKRVFVIVRLKNSKSKLLNTYYNSLPSIRKYRSNIVEQYLLGKNIYEVSEEELKDIENELFD